MKKTKNLQSAENKKIWGGILLGVILGVAGVCIGSYQVLKHNDLKQEIYSVKASIEEMNQVKKISFDSKAAFETAVAASINKFIDNKQQQNIEQKYSSFENASENNDKRIYGDINARFTLVEYSDLECPFCKQFHETPKELVDSSKGNINWQWKHMPLDFHNPAALKEALAAECVAEQKGNRGFWVFVNDVFVHSQGNGRGVADLPSLVSGVGANLKDFQNCMASGRHQKTIETDMQKAKSYGVNGTPATFIVDNYTGKSQLLAGAQPAQAFMAVIRKMMQESDDENKRN